VMVNKAKIKREQYINDMVERKISERMSKLNVSKAPTSTQINKTPVSQVPKPAVVQKPAVVKKPSKFAGKVTPLWARGFEL